MARSFRKPAVHTKQFTLDVLGRTWSVSFAEMDEDDLACFGATTVEDHSIHLYRRPHRKHPARGPIEQTLLHEVIHAALCSGGLNALLPGGKEEAVVVALEHALWPLIQSGWFQAGALKKRGL